MVSGFGPPLFHPIAPPPPPPMALRSITLPRILSAWECMLPFATAIDGLLMWTSTNTLAAAVIDLWRWCHQRSVSDLWHHTEGLIGTLWYDHVIGGALVGCHVLSSLIMPQSHLIYRHSSPTNRPLLLKFTHLTSDTSSLPPRSHKSVFKTLSKP